MRTVDIDGHEWRVLHQEMDYSAKHGVAISTERNGKKYRYAVRIDVSECPTEEEAVAKALPILGRWARGEPESSQDEAQFSIMAPR